MYLSNVSEYKAFISLVNHNLPKNHTIKNQSLYEHCARAMGYKTDASLRVDLPFKFDFFSFHDDFLGILKNIQCSFKCQNVLKLAAIEKYGADYVCTEFPITVPSGFSFYLNINFDDGFTSKPLEASDENLKSSTFSEFYNNSFRIQLGRLVTAQAYVNLLKEIAPLVNQVCGGYRYQGAEKKALFTSEAENALERLSFINVDGIEIVDYNYGAKIWEPEDIYEYYSCDGEFDKQKNGEVTFVHFGENIAMSNSSDDELKSSAESEIGSLEAEVNLYDLISHFKDLRDMCKEHKYKLLEEATSSSQQSL
jgi:hypothetical protein